MTKKKIYHIEMYQVLVPGTSGINTWYCIEYTKRNKNSLSILCHPPECTLWVEHHRVYV